jgi:hypothetical protein
MTKIQLKRIYKHIYKYNNTQIKQYDNLKHIAKALSTVYTQGYKNIDYNKNIIYYPEFFVKCDKNNNKFTVNNITYFTKNNQCKDLF